MKRIALLLFIGMLSLSMNAQETVQAKKVDKNAPIFKFQKEVIDYGNIELNSDGKRFFEFTNVGKSPLIIKNVKGSCGCTVPSAPKEPIMPGEKGKIEVVYATNRPGSFSKNVTITSNASEAVKVISIRGNVKKESSLSALEKLEKKEKSMLSEKKEK